MISSVDITSFMNWFLTQFTKMLKTCYDILDSITFWGFSLFDWILGISIIGAMSAVLFTFAPSTVNMITRGEKRNVRKDSKKDEK